jgi:hypothetical protein
VVIRHLLRNESMPRGTCEHFCHNDSRGVKRLDIRSIESEGAKIGDRDDSGASNPIPTGKHQCSAWVSNRRQPETDMNMKRVHGDIVVLVALLAIGSVSFAVAAKKQNHHDGHRLVAAKLKTDGHHDLEKRGHYTSSVESKGGKIAAFHVMHDTKGEIPVKKYKSNKKMVQVTGSHLTDASLALPQEDMGTVEIGYSYIDDDGNEEIYWFPAEEVLDPDTGAVEYVPLSS